jgi:hypothetical protein
LDEGGDGSSFVIFFGFSTTFVSFSSTLVTFREI